MILVPNRRKHFRGGGGGITAKSVALDVLDNHGSTFVLGVRSVDFISGGTKIEVAPADMAAFGSTTNSSSRDADKAFDTSLSKTGSAVGTGYQSLGGVFANQRFFITFVSPITFDSIIINNYHASGTLTDRGANNVKAYTTEDTGAISTVFNSAITGSVLIYDSVFAEHTVADAEDPETLVLI